ncbi:MAG: VanZ family protein, partial [Patescibacteria group bacterium]|nr:VanZ family protein [Patescibacteria group bacterium]
AVLYFLLYQAFKQLGTKTKNIWKKAFIISLIYALTDEFHQSLVPGRSATLRDVGFDFLGISLIILRKFKYI